ncbi:hypothetical protein PFISCL1PPCAC_582, partial [Pristionchus fissidentatus]
LEWSSHVDELRLRLGNALRPCSKQQRPHLLPQLRNRRLMVGLHPLHCSLHIVTCVSLVLNLGSGYHPQLLQSISLLLDQ